MNFDSQMKLTPPPPHTHTHAHTHTVICTQNVCIAVHIHFHLMLTSVSTCNMLSNNYILSRVATFMARGIVAIAYGATSVITWNY